jgi:very-short-patch-repair endonuclease
MKRDPLYAERARELRADANEAEKRMWSTLRAKRMRGLKFRRQHAIGSHIADFVCLQANLVIEIDGDTHGTDEREALDAKRSEHIERLGFRVIRFWNDDVFNATDGVVETIAGALDTAVPSASPSP